MSDDRDGLADAVEKALTKASTMSALLLACGEMTAQERRTARAVAGLMQSIALTAIRNHPSASPDRDEGERVREACAKVCDAYADANEAKAYALFVSTPDATQQAPFWHAFHSANEIAAEIRALPLAQEEKP